MKKISKISQIALLLLALFSVVFPYSSTAHTGYERIVLVAVGNYNTIQQSSGAIKPDNNPSTVQKWVNTYIENGKFKPSSYTPLVPIEVADIKAGEKISPVQYIGNLYRMLFGLAAVFAVIMGIISGFGYIVSGDSLYKKMEAKKRLQNLAAGIGLLLSSYVILYTVNPQLVNISLGTLSDSALNKVQRNSRGIADLFGDYESFNISRQADILYQDALKAKEATADYSKAQNLIKEKEEALKGYEGDDKYEKILELEKLKVDAEVLRNEQSKNLTLSGWRNNRVNYYKNKDPFDGLKGDEDLLIYIEEKVKTVYKENDQTLRYTNTLNTRINENKESIKLLDRELEEIESIGEEDINFEKKKKSIEDRKKVQEDAIKKFEEMKDYNKEKFLIQEKYSLILDSIGKVSINRLEESYLALKKQTELKDENNLVIKKFNDDVKGDQAVIEARIKKGKCDAAMSARYGTSQNYVMQSTLPKECL